MMRQSKYVAFYLAMLMSLFANFGTRAEKGSDSSDVSGSSDRVKRFSGSLGLLDVDDVSREESDSDIDNVDKKASHFLRIGKAYPMNRFIRIGRFPKDLSIDDQTDTDVFENDKRTSRFVRIGKNPSRFVRIGKSPSRFVRIGKSPSRFVRIGKSAFDNEQDEDEKRASRFVRIGKQLQPSSEQAASSRFRRETESSRSVRVPSSFVRIGKAPSNFVRIGRKPSSFVRIGKSDFDLDDDKFDTDYAEAPEYNDKRASRFVRIGKGGLGSSDSIIEYAGSPSDEEKRLSNFVRIGKSELDEESSDSKRASNFLRIGKSDQNNNAVSYSEKTGSNFVHPNEPSTSDNANSSPSFPYSHSSSESVQDGNPADRNDAIKVATRSSAFVRIGKIPYSAFVRIGKNTDSRSDQTDHNRGSRGGQSSFVRIGK